MIEPSSALTLDASPRRLLRVRVASWLARARPISWLLRLAVFVLALSLARATLGDEYLVPTSSMWPTITPGDRIFVSKTAYGLKLPFFDRYLIEGGSPSVGEIIVFADPRGGSTLLVKRVVALEGQRVEMTRGVLSIDGVPQPIEWLDGDHLVEHLGQTTHEAGQCDTEDFGPYIVPKDRLFVMGDNRAVSLDSRAMGPIPRKLVKGRVLGAVLRLGDEEVDLTTLLRPIR